MSVSIDSFTLTNPNPSSSALFLRRASMALCPSPMSLQWKCLLRPHGVSVVSRTVSPTKLGLGLLPLPPRSLRNRSVFSFASSREESAFSDKAEEEESDLKVGAEESEEAWKQTLASFKEQALKMQSVSQEAYELYSKKAMVILKETSEQWKVQAEKARNDLSIVAKEISEESKKNLSTAAEISPEPVKDIVETFASSTDDVNELSKMRDFYLGIPYGILLSSGGFLSFMLTGSLSALRFGVILGGALLAFSISSLRSWRRGESFPLALKGQAAIASILFLRETRMLFQEPTIGSLFTAFVSGVMVAFYLYRLALNDGQGKRATGTQN
ncbi:protein FATTY ACID EXPORT 3, chloroplastic [Cornus florida]|uniref:protein FATTY ACID EXPORT 3, chloroplastic n=1 Tax=Cornus florida TaxID=4283 RepID=UPI00289758C2|nr:protein FATTY ACID EXPORT 3, chloroplastic [Cornus florida]